MNIIEALVVALKLDGSQYQAGLEKAQRSLESFAGKEREIEKSRDKQQAEQAKKQKEAERKASREREQQLRNAAEGYRRVRNEIIGMVGAAMGMSSIKSFVTNSVTGLVNVGRAATDLNMSARSVAAWGRTIETVGGKSEDMIGTMRAMNLAIANAKEGFDVDSPFFAFLNNQGIKWQNASGKIREMGQMLPEIADAFNKFRPEQQAILARQFGWSDDFVALMRKGSAEIRRIQAEKFASEVLTEDDIKRAQKFQEAWAKISELFGKTGREVFLALVPTLEKLNALLLRFANWVSQNSDTISAFFVGIGNALAIAVEMFGGLHKATDGWSTNILAAVTALAALKGALGGILSMTGLPMLLKLLGGGAAGGGLAALGKLGMVGAAGAAGYGLGTLMNKYVVDPTVRALTGDKHATLGTWLYDKMNPDAGNAATSTGGKTGTTSARPSTSLVDTIVNSSFGQIMKKAEGDYGIVNTGKRRGNRAEKVNLEGMTVAQVMAAQARGDFNAAGRYQIIGSTLREAAKGIGLSGNEMFDKATQDRIFVEYLLKQKRRAALNYINNNSDNLQAAMLAVSQEWASFADPRTGKSFYDGDGVNRASVGAQQLAAMLQQLRSQVMSSTTNRSDVQINGGITINTAATDAAGIAKEIRPAVNRSMAGVTALGMN